MEVTCMYCDEEDYGGVIELVYKGWRTFCDCCVCPACAIERESDNDIVSTYILTLNKYDIDGE